VLAVGQASYLEVHNPEQRRAVEHGVGPAGTVGTPLPVIAGAGSGKTNTHLHFEARNRHRDGSAEDCSVSQQQGHHRKETIGGEAEEKSYDNPRGAPVNLRIQPGHYLLCSLF
jgi:hypothetical protein